VPLQFLPLNPNLSLQTGSQNLNLVKGKPFSESEQLREVHPQQNLRRMITQVGSHLAQDKGVLIWKVTLVKGLSDLFRESEHFKPARRRIPRLTS